MIALTLPSIRTVTLLGDPLQLSATVFSQNSNNENADYHGRSLMETLDGAGYPLSVLLTNYRCHPDMLDPFNQIFYGGLRDLAIRFKCDGQDYLADLQHFGSVDVDGVMSWWFQASDLGSSLADLALKKYELIHLTY